MKIGFNCSSFDLFHAGHVTMLKIEKEMCDYLKVALQVDPTIDRPGIKNKPVQSAYERYVQLQGCKYIDEILVYETEEDLLNLIQSQTIHIRFLSEEYKDRDFAEIQYKVTDYYYPEYDRTLIWDDVDLNIEWGVDGDPILSQKDSKGKTFQECEKYV